MIAVAIKEIGPFATEVKHTNSVGTRGNFSLLAPLSSPLSLLFLPLEKVNKLPLAECYAG